MTEDAIGRHVRDAITAFSPPYPHDMVRTRLAALRRVPARRPGRRDVRVAVSAALALAVVAATAAIAVPIAIPDPMIRALDRVGVHLRGKTMVPIESREVSLDEARAAAGFPVLVPLGVRVVRVLLSTEQRHRRSAVSLVLQDDRGSQVQLEESRAVAEPPGRAVGRSYQYEPNGRLIELRTIRWAIGETRLRMDLYDARSRTFAERVRGGPFGRSALR